MGGVLYGLGLRMCLMTGGTSVFGERPLGVSRSVAKIRKWCLGEIQTLMIGTARPSFISSTTPLSEQTHTELWAPEELDQVV